MNIITNTTPTRVIEILKNIGYNKTANKTNNIVSIWDLPDNMPIRERLGELIKALPGAAIILDKVKETVDEDDNISEEPVMYPNDWKQVAMLTSQNTVWYFGKEEYIHIKNNKTLKSKHDNSLATIIWKINESIKRERMNFNTYDFNLVNYYLSKGLSKQEALTKVAKINIIIKKEDFQNKLNGLFSLLDVYLDTENSKWEDIMKQKYLYMIYFKDTQDVSLLKTYRANPQPNSLESEFDQLEPEFNAINAIDRIKKFLDIEISISQIFEPVEMEFYSTDLIENMFSLDE